MPIEMKAIGTVEPIASVQIKSKVQGEILQVHFADGAQVKAGDSLFSIDPRPFEVALQRAKANLAFSQSAANNASEQAARYSSLIKSGVASKEQTAQFLSTAQSLQSELEARQADVAEAGLSIEWSRVVSPLTGRAGAALLKAGNIAQAHTDILTVINQMQPIYVTFSLPENSLADVRRWMEAGRPAVTAYEPDTGRELGAGELNFVDNAVDRASGMITFKASFPNENESLWPGQFVDVQVKLAEQTGAIVIPTTAIMEGQKGSQVFVVEGDTVSLRPIEVDRSTGSLAIIAEGLAVGEKVVTTGQLRLNAGDTVAVRVAPESAPVPEDSSAPEAP